MPNKGPCSTKLTLLRSRTSPTSCAQRFPPACRALSAGTSPRAPPAPAAVSSHRRGRERAARPRCWWPSTPTTWSFIGRNRSSGVRDYRCRARRWRRGSCCCGWMGPSASHAVAGALRHAVSHLHIRYARRTSGRAHAAHATRPAHRSRPCGPCRQSAAAATRPPAECAVGSGSLNTVHSYSVFGLWTSNKSSLQEGAASLRRTSIWAS